MTLVDSDYDISAKLLEIYDGAKLMRRLNCTLKCKIFQHVIEKESDSCIEIVAFLLFHETADQLRKVVELERLYLSTQKVLDEVHKAQKTRVKIKIGNLPFLVNCIYDRICISSDMQLQLKHSVIQNDGTRLECNLDLSFDGIKILAQLPHIDNIKDETRRAGKSGESEETQKMLAWGLKIASFHIEINACESALVVANVYMETVSQAIQMFLHHFEKSKTIIEETGDNRSSIVKSRWKNAIRRTLLQNHVKKFTKRLQEIGGYLPPITIESIESRKKKSMMIDYQGLDLDLEKKCDDDYRSVKLPSFLNVKFDSKKKKIEDSDCQSFQRMPLRRSARSLSHMYIDHEPNEVLEELDNSETSDSSCPSIARPSLRKSSLRKNSRRESTVRREIRRESSVRRESTISKLGLHSGRTRNSVQDITEGVELFHAEMTKAFHNEGSDNEPLQGSNSSPLTKCPLLKSKSLKVIPSNARPLLQKIQEKENKPIKRKSTTHCINKVKEVVEEKTLLILLPLLQALCGDNQNDPCPKDLGPKSPRGTPRRSSITSIDLIPLIHPKSLDQSTFNQLNPILRPRGNSDLELSPISPHLASSRRSSIVVEGVDSRRSRPTSPMMRCPSISPLCSPRSIDPLLL